MTNKYAIILAGGSGTRLWPYSRKHRPKQLLELVGEQSLLQETVKRILPVIEAKNISIVTSQHYRDRVCAQLKEIDFNVTQNIFLEPVGRNTLPAISWITTHLAKTEPQAITFVFPSDHVIGNQKAFMKALDQAANIATQGYIVVFGINPTRPSTSYGYVKAGTAITEGCKEFLVEKFVEKPNVKTAKSYLSKGNYFWNSGMFVFRNDILLTELEKYEPKIFSLSQKLVQKNQHLANANLFGSMPNQSIDYGIMERTEKAAVVPVDMDWSDLGSWESVYQHLDKDKDGNVVRGEVITLDSSDNLILSQKGLVATLGINHLAILQTKDALLICPIERSDELKSVISRVNEAYPHLTEDYQI